MITIDKAMIKKQMNTAHRMKVETDMMCNKFFCSLCIFTTRKMEEYTNHLVNEHNKEEHSRVVKEIKAELSCDECEIVYPSRSMFSSYLDSVYSGDKGNTQVVKPVTFKEGNSDKSIKDEEEKKE